MFAGPSRDYGGTEKTSIKGVLPGSSLSNTPSSYFSIQSLSHVQLFVTPWTAAHQAFCPSSFPRACANLYPFSWWCHPTVSSSVTLFSSCPQSLPASGSFPMSWLFSSGGKNIGASASASVFSMNIQGWLNRLNPQIGPGPDGKQWFLASQCLCKKKAGVEGYGFLPSYPTQCDV